MVTTPVTESRPLITAGIRIIPRDLNDFSIRQIPIVLKVREGSNPISTTFGGLTEEHIARAFALELTDYSPNLPVFEEILLRLQEGVKAIQKMIQYELIDPLLNGQNSVTLSSVKISEVLNRTSGDGTRRFSWS